MCGGMVGKGVVWGQAAQAFSPVQALVTVIRAKGVGAKVCVCVVGRQGGNCRKGGRAVWEGGGGGGRVGVVAGEAGRGQVGVKGGKGGWWVGVGRGKGG